MFRWPCDTQVDGQGRRARHGGQSSRAEVGQAHATQRSKTALVLGGGGFTGRRLRDRRPARASTCWPSTSTVNEFDVYVGTSAGLVHRQPVANGVTPGGDDAGAQQATCPRRSATSTSAMLLRPNYRGFAAPRSRLPFTVAGVARELAGNLAEIVGRRPRHGPRRRRCRKGFYTGTGIERYVDGGALRPRPHRRLPACSTRELYLTATDLDTTERVVLGEGEWADVPISKAVAASGALPLVYEPVEIKGREFIDGGIRSTTNIDVAVETRRQVHRRHQPDRPLRQRLHASAIPTVIGIARPPRLRHGPRRRSRNQAFRMISHDRLHRAVEELGGASTRASTSS